MRSDKIVGDDSGSPLDSQLQEECDFLLATPQFRRSPTLSRLLKFLVGYELSDSASPPKAYTVAVECLGRDDSFDPHADSYPRVMVGRLRQLLQTYYATGSRRYQIIIPSGSYSVQLIETARSPLGDADFGLCDAQNLTGDDNKSFLQERLIIPILLASFAVIFAVIIYTFYNYYSIKEIKFYERPVLIILNSPENSRLDLDDRDLFSSISYMISRFENIELKDSNFLGKGNSLSQKYDYVLLYQISNFEDNYFINLSLTESAGQEVIWNERFRQSNRNWVENVNIQRAINAIASDVGIIAVDYLRRNPDQNLLGYPCLARTYKSRNDLNLSKVEGAFPCLKNSLEYKPNDPQILSGLSLATLMKAKRLGSRHQPGAAAALVEGVRYAEEAYTANPLSPKANYAMARASFLQEQCKRGQRFGERSVAQNPYDGWAIEMFGVYLARCGYQDAEKYLLQGIELEPTGPSFPRYVLAIHYVLTDQTNKAKNLLEEITPEAQPSPMYLLSEMAISASNGDLVIAKANWNQINAKSGSATPHQTIKALLLSDILTEKFVTKMNSTGFKF